MSGFNRTKAEIRCEECGVYGAGPFTGLCDRCYHRKYASFRRAKWIREVGPLSQTSSAEPDFPEMDGISRYSYLGVTYWVARWTVGPYGKRKSNTRMFSLEKYGSVEAHRLAVEAKEDGEWEDYLDQYIALLKKAEKLTGFATIHEVRKAMEGRQHVMIWVEEMDLFIPSRKSEFRQAIRFAGGNYEALLYELYANDTGEGTLFVKVAKK